MSERAYSAHYKALGYEIVEEKAGTNLDDMTVKELRELAKDKDIEGYYDMKKDELITALKVE
ncbi:Rho termination factor N-terminal domain-containing protein [Halocella sp. SP3-1]|uniref:Rho termination factor N-terminal domain-containing protein n=1 Tax=Halocella sp. SP3-1 TaxID=2382161 RepID=UPI0025706192|nr:Rho termination factor N-terminal domain-containing protein [Halocella sp. SP3-1]